MKEYSRSPDLAELLRMAIAANQANVHVSLPGSVEAYDAERQVADVKPLLRRPLVAADGTELDAESLPILMDVPIAFPRGGGFFMSLPLVRGDLVHLVFVERSMDQWLDGEGAETTPLDYRMHSLADAVAYPGLYPRGLPLADAHVENMVLGLDGDTAAHFRPDGEIHLGSDEATDYIALADLVKTEISALRDTVNSLVTAYNAHIHITTATVGASPTPGIISPTTSTATPPAAVGDVAATKVKAD